MIHISLFSGIGGFELAAEWMGWRNWVSCDINDFGNKVREHYWPNGYCHKDVKTLTYETINKELSDRFGFGWRDDDIILTGGFPCQPYSAAGKRLGKEDERHLWPEMLRVISEVKPTYIVGENVRGLTNWNGGVVFEEVCADLEALGYEVQPVLLPACAVGAPHRRDRIWFVAYSSSYGYDDKSTKTNNYSRKNNKQSRSEWECAIKRFSNERSAANTNSDGQHQCNSQHEINPSQGGQHALGNLEPSHGDGDAADTECEGLFGSNETRGTNFINRENSKIWGNSSGYNQKNNRDAADTECIRRRKEWKDSKSRQPYQKDGDGDATDTDSGRQSIEEYWQEKSGLLAKKGIPGNWQNFPTQSPVCGGDDGLSTRLDSITFSKWRNESIKAYGNAIVPQVAYQIFKAICQSTSNCETFNSDLPTTDSNQTSPKPTNYGWNNSNDQ